MGAVTKHGFNMVQGGVRTYLQLHPQALLRTRAPRAFLPLRDLLRLQTTITISLLKEKLQNYK